MSQGGASFEYRGGAKLRHHSQAAGCESTSSPSRPPPTPGLRAHRSLHPHGPQLHVDRTTTPPRNDETCGVSRPRITGSRGTGKSPQEMTSDAPGARTHRQTPSGGVAPEEPHPKQSAGASYSGPKRTYPAPSKITPTLANIARSSPTALALESPASRTRSDIVSRTKPIVMSKRAACLAIVKTLLQVSGRGHPVRKVARNPMPWPELYSWRLAFMTELFCKGTSVREDTTDVGRLPFQTID